MVFQRMCDPPIESDRESGTTRGTVRTERRNTGRKVEDVLAYIGTGDLSIQGTFSGYAGLASRASLCPAGKEVGRNCKVGTVANADAQRRRNGTGGNRENGESPACFSLP